MSDLHLHLISVKCRIYTYFRCQNLSTLADTNVTRDPILLLKITPPSVPSPSPLPSDMQLSHRILLLWLAYRVTKRSRETGRKYSRYRKEFFKSLSIEERRRRYRKIPRSVLIPLALSPWQKFHASRNDQAYITMMWFDVESFEKIIENSLPCIQPTPLLTNQGWLSPSIILADERERCFRWIA